LGARKFIADDEATDGRDVSGANEGSPSQIIYKDGKFYPVPYDEAYVRAGSGKSKSNEGNKQICTGDSKQTEISQKEYWDKIIDEHFARLKRRLGGGRTGNRRKRR
jgi:hypothetical protein